MDDKPSILFVLPWHLSAAGGINQVVINLARETERHGQLRPIFVCNDWQEENLHIGEFEGIMRVSARLRPPVASSRMVRNLAGFALKMRSEIGTWSKFMRNHRVAVVNAHYAESGQILFALLHALGRPRFRLIFSLHGADMAAMQEANTATRATTRWMLKQADHIVCCSEDLSARAREQLQLEHVPISTIHNGIDFDELDRAKHHAYRPDTGDFDSYLINVATYEHKKGQDILLEAYLKLVREGLQSALVLVGRSTPHLASLRSRVRQLGLHKHVFFVPDLDHARTLAAIRKARLFVLPSRAEPFGIVLLEAAYMRTPIVASQTGGIPEVLGRYYPYMVPAEDPDALAQCIDDALFNPTETERQVRLLRRLVGNKSSWQHAYERYLSIWLDTA